jgi:IgA-specific serine endopeptidase
MFKVKGDKKQKFSLRSYKGIGAASVLVGVLALSGGIASAHEGLVDNGDGTTIISNDKGSVKLKSSHVTVSTKVGDGPNNIDSNAILEKEKGILKTEEAKISDKSTETFRKEGNVDVKYVTGDGAEIKEKLEVPVDKVLDGSFDKTVNSEIHGDFGKIIKDGIDQGASRISVEKVEAENLSPKTIIKGDKTYHFVDRTVEENDYNYSKDVTFGDITKKVTVDGLHRNDGSVKFENIKDGSRLWLVEELANNKYGRYLTVRKTSDMDEDKVIEILKSGLNGAKIFNKNNVDADGGIINTDYLMFFERNTFARVDKRIIGESKSGAVGNLNDENSFNDNTGYSLLYNINNVNATGKINGDIDRNVVLKKINSVSPTSSSSVDSLGRPISNYKYTIKGAIGNKVYESFEEFKKDLSKTPVFLKDFSNINNEIGWSPINDPGEMVKKALLLEPTFSDHVLTNDELIELNKNTLNNYADYKAGTVSEDSSGLTSIVRNHNDAINFRKNIVYDKSPMLDKVDFNRYVIEYNAKLVDQKIYDDSIKYGFYTDLREGKGTTYKIYGQYTENGVVHRAPINVRNPFYVAEGIEGLKDVQYNDMYSVNRAYKVINEGFGFRSVISNIYSEELKEEIVEKGHIKVKYVDEAGVELLGSKVTDEKDASVITKKYYLYDEGINKGVRYDVSSDKLTKNTPYDVSGFEYKPLGINKSDVSYVFSRLDGKEQGVLEPGEKTVTFIYKKVEPKVVTEVIEPAVTYTGDKTKPVGSENVTEAGAKGSKVTTTTYTVNEKTGEVIPHVGEPVVTKAGTTVVKVGAQDKVTYKKQGNDVVKVTISYEVDSKTGKLTEKTTESVHAKDGAKDGTSLITIDGDGIYSKSTVHSVDEKTGVVRSTSDMKLVKKFEAEKSDQEFKERALPNTGSNSTSTAGLGFSAIAVAMMIAKRRSESDGDNV